MAVDEVHTYAGAQATEVAFLLRKMRRRLGLDAKDIRCIGTRASLAAGEEATQKILEFASRLFGAPFSKVIRGRRQEHHLLLKPAKEPFSLPGDARAKLGAVMAQPTIDADARVHQWNDVVSRLAIPAELKK